MLKKLMQDFILGLANSTSQIVQVSFLAGSMTLSQVAIEVGISPQMSEYIADDTSIQLDDRQASDREGQSGRDSFFQNQVFFSSPDLENSFVWSSDDMGLEDYQSFYENSTPQSFIESLDLNQASPPLSSATQAFTSPTPGSAVVASSFFELAQNASSRSIASSNRGSSLSRAVQSSKDLVNQALVNPIQVAAQSLVKEFNESSKEPSQGQVKIEPDFSGSSAEASLSSPASNSSGNTTPTTTIPVVEPEAPTTTTTTTTLPVAEPEPEAPAPTTTTTTVPAPPQIQKKKVLVISDEQEQSPVQRWTASLGAESYEVSVIGRGESAPVSFEQFDLLILNLNQGLHPSDARALRGLSTPILTCQPVTSVELGFVLSTDQSQPNNKQDIRITNTSHPLFDGLNISTQISIFRNLIPVGFAERATANAIVLASWSSSAQSDRTLVFIDAGTGLNQGGSSGGHRGFYPCSSRARDNYTEIGETLFRRSADYLTRPSE